MITYAGFQRRFGALLLALLVDLFVFAVLRAVGVGEYLSELFVAWFLIHHVGLVAEGGSFGHRLLGLRVVRVDGGRVGVIMAAVRFVVEIASLLPLGLGMLWMLDQRQRRTWHDLAAGTIVVRETPRVETAGPEWADAPPWRTPHSAAPADTQPASSQTIVAE